MRVMITGTAGFIGFHLARRLLASDHEVVGIDGMTPYYDVRLKAARTAILAEHPRFSYHTFMLEEAQAIEAVAERARPEIIVHLAAQAGVRYSLDNPRAYIETNLIGTFNVMEVARRLGVRHFLLASTSSVYGANESIPFKETERVAHPMSIYAATKESTEQMTHAYSHLWSIPTTAFRFFTVYGPWGRPDMALFKFVAAILDDQPVDVFNGGQMERDFTYIDDLIEAVVRLMDAPPKQGAPVFGDSLSPVAPWRVVNIGGGAPIALMDFIGEIERRLGREARLNLMPMQPGDVPRTFADPALLETLTGYRPSTPVSVGVGAFCDWYETYYQTREAT